MTDAELKKLGDEHQAKRKALLEATPKGSDIWFYMQGAYCIHCVVSISLESAMIANVIPKGGTEYIGGPGYYAERLAEADVEAYTHDMAEHGLGPCECPELFPVPPTEGTTP